MLEEKMLQGHERSEEWQGLYDMTSVVVYKTVNSTRCGEIGGGGIGMHGWPCEC